MSALKSQPATRPSSAAVGQMMPPPGTSIHDGSAGAGSSGSSYAANPVYLSQPRTSVKGSAAPAAAASTVTVHHSDSGFRLPQVEPSAMEFPPAYTSA